MFDMNFVSFLMLTVISGVVAYVYHYVAKYRCVQTYDAFIGKLILGWFGAWIGTPIFGQWFWKVESVYIFPAIIGAIAVIHLNTLFWKTIINLTSMRTPQIEEMKMRKAA